MKAPDGQFHSYLLAQEAFTSFGLCLKRKVGQFLGGERLERLSVVSGSLQFRDQNVSGAWEITE